MSYEACINKGNEGPEVRSVYCSESVKVGRLVAFQAALPTASGSSEWEGLTVKYPTGTTSLVCGVIYPKGGGVTGYNTGDMCLVQRRGYVKDFMSFETGTVGHVFKAYTALGLGESFAGAIVADWTVGSVCGVYLETNGGTATTTSDIYVNAWA